MQAELDDARTLANTYQRQKAMAEEQLEQALVCERSHRPLVHAPCTPLSLPLPPSATP